MIQILLNLLRISFDISFDFFDYFLPIICDFKKNLRLMQYIPRAIDIDSSRRPLVMYRTLILRAHILISIWA